MDEVHRFIKRDDRQRYLYKILDRRSMSQVRMRRTIWLLHHYNAWLLGKALLQIKPH